MNKNNSKVIFPQIDFEINSESFTKVDIYSLNRTDQIVGKPSKYIVEIIRRFLKNKWAAGLFIVFLIIILTTIIAPFASPYSPTTPIASGGSILINLPPRLSLSDFPLQKMYGQLSDINIAKSNGIFVTGSDKYLNAGNGLWEYFVSPYTFPSLQDKISILGTDGGGIDIWTKLWASVAQSLWVAVVIAIASTVFGVIYGAISGSFAGKAADTVMMRIVDILSGVPTLIWLIILSVVITSAQSSSGDATQGSGVTNISIIPSLIFVSWMSPAISTRTYILKNKDAEYVQASRTLGSNQARIIFSHMIPVILGRLAVIFVNLIPTVIFYEASLVFIGLKSTTELGLGVMLNDAWRVQNVALIASPIVTFALITISAQIIANALNDAIDPRVVGRN